jgi:hypothetical protein
MIRTVLVAGLLAAALSGCNPCQRIYNADLSANEKGKDCGAGNSTSVNVNSCTNGLSSCSQDDMAKLNNYADCLEKLPVCNSGQSFSWGLQRVGCYQALSGTSGNCLNAINNN